ncbi:uncharacterized protein LOC116250367 [Nymphaea colorata]|nr:uncharacterized protein LOC116250367 [Nymphaea colorata]
MYVTRPLSFYKRSASALSLPPPEGPHSGYLLIQGQDGQDYNRCSCFGMPRDTRYKSLPLPQDRVLTVRHFEHRGGHEIVVHTDETIFIPVPGQPLSSNLYYVVRADGERMGLVSTCSSEEDVCSCQCRCIKDVAPQRLDSRNRYQRMKVTNRSGSFVIGSAASDGIPPQFLRRAGWAMYKSELLPPFPKIPEAQGLNAALRSKLPKFDFDVSKKRSEPVVVGEWYCPFIFIREFGGLDHPKAQMEQSFLYRMSLEQQWEEIFSVEAATDQDQAESVAVGTVVAREEALIGGRAEIHEEWKVEDGMMVLRAKNVKEGLVGVGLSVEIAQKMVEDQRKGPSDVVDVRVDRVFQSRKKPWKRFGCYVLVERYVLRRMNGEVVLTYSFRHTNRIQPKWE